MKKTIIISLLLAMALSVQAQREFTITGVVTNVEDGSIFNLYRKEGRMLVPVGRDTIMNGTFMLKGQTDKVVERLDIALYGKKPSGMIRPIYVSPGAQITIQGDSLYIFDWKIESNLTEQKEDNRFIAAARQAYYKQERLNRERNEWFAVADSAKTKEERKKAIQKTRKLMIPIKEAHTEMYKAFVETMGNMPVSTVWMDKLYDLSVAYRYTPEFPYHNETLAYFNRLTEEQKSTPVGKEIAINLSAKSEVKPGSNMIDADLYDLEGNLHHLAELKGKYILLDFWSSGCGPCIMAIPEMGEVQEKYKDKLAIVSLSSDSERIWKEASAKHPMTWYNWSDKKQTSGLYLKYGVRGIPHYVLISPEGKVASTWSGYGKGSLLKKMRELIKGKTSEK